MAFVVEDGTGKADANSYVSVDTADDYFAERGNSAWGGTEEEKQSYLILATDYIELRFVDRFIGYRKTQTQALSWPRTGASDPAGGCLADDAVPLGVQRATCEYALRAKLNPNGLAPDPALSTGGITTVETKRKVGPLEKTFAVAAAGYGSQVQLVRAYPAADMRLRGLLRPTAHRVIR